jgi:RNA polymerase sigma-B factor
LAPAEPPASSHHRSGTGSWCDTDALLSRWREGKDPAAREELVARFLPLARKLATRYHSSAGPIEDLVQVASIGLLEAIDRFDPSRGIPFPAFAVPTIIGELKHYYRTTGWSAHVPSGAQELALRVDRAAQEITAHSGHRARLVEVAESLNLTANDVRTGVDTATARYSLSLDTPVSGADRDEAHPLAESIGGEDARYEIIESALSVSAALTRLPELERQALTLRLTRAMTQIEIARQLDCSRSHVSHLLRRAARRLYELMDPPLSGG